MITILKKRYHQFFYNAVVHGRCRNIAKLIVLLLPTGPISLLDIGCGNGQFASELSSIKNTLHITGVEVILHADCRIDAQVYNGTVLPYADKIFDYAMLINVLHHAADPAQLLSEAVRVAKNGVIIKDHYSHSKIDFYTLKLMDIAGNAFHNVNQPYRYFSEQQWNRLFGKLDLKIEKLLTRFSTYNNTILDKCFGRNLHFIALVKTAL